MSVSKPVPISPHACSSPSSQAAGHNTSALAQMSAFIICRNERTMLGACLDSLAGIGEIVIADSGSTDGTLDLIAEYQSRGWPLRLFHRDWSGFSAQKQFALDQCVNDWCLNLDCDERLSEDLRRAINDLTLGDSGPIAYSFPLRDWLPGYGYAPRLVHTHQATRLFRKSRARYDHTALVHERLLLDGAIAPIGAGYLLHYRNLPIARELDKANRYSTLKARQKFAAGERSSLARILLRPVWRFTKSYILQRYIVCGVPGLIYSALLGNYVFLTEAKLYRLQCGRDVPDEP
ncbi:glycosyltransferase family 2 protein [Aquibium carbonis]|uniref:Glycosyltransferase family 2 protein n=1 Tax=Aquibium carbonis TaxID=2495581 RepID=A0A3R9ZUJ6_9HYPH|nr:glycosyltransferase family 2 protein [Aquibium carbonis]RST88059.1 glycosyltransferase family 2 protein [Aquibium carbonis]